MSSYVESGSAMLTLGGCESGELLQYHHHGGIYFMSGTRMSYFTPHSLVLDHPYRIHSGPHWIFGAPRNMIIWGDSVETSNPFKSYRFVTC